MVAVTKSNNKDKSTDKNKLLIKVLLVYLCYFLYSNIISSVLTLVGVNDTTIISFAADIIFLIGIVFAYKENLKSDFLKLRKNYTSFKIVKELSFLF